MKHLNKTKKIIISITSFISLGIFYPIAIFVPKAIWAMGLMSFDDADPDDVDKILSFSANGTSFLIPLIIMMFVILICGLIGTYFIVKGKTKFEKRWGWMTVLAGGFGISAIYALISAFKSKETKIRIPRASKGFKTTTIVATPIIALAPIVGVAMYHAGPDQATHVNGVHLAKAHYDDGKLTDKTNIIELFTDGLDPNWGMPIIEKDKELNDFEVFDHFVAPGGETSYSLPLLISGMEGYNEFSKRFQRGGGYASMGQKNLSGELNAFHTLFADMGTPTKNNHLGYPNQYLINPTSLSSGNYQQAVSGNAKLAKERFYSDVKSAGKDIPAVDVKVVNWAQTKADLAGKFGISHYSPDNAFFGWFNQEAVADKDVAPTHVYLREGMTHSPRNTAPDGSVSYWTGDNPNGRDLTLVNATQSEIDSLDATMKHLKEIDAYDNSLIIIYGDHANHKTALAHPDNGKTDGDKYHSVAMIKYPGQIGSTKTGPDISNIGFYGGDIHNVLDHFKENQDDTFDKVFTNNLDGMFDVSKNSDQKIYATFYKDHLGYFKFDSNPLNGNATQLHLLSKDEQEIKDIKTETDLKDQSPAGWLTYAEFDKYAKSHSFVEAWEKLTLDGKVK